MKQYLSPREPIDIYLNRLPIYICCVMRALCKSCYTVNSGILCRIIKYKKQIFVGTLIFFKLINSNQIMYCKKEHISYL